LGLIGAVRCKLRVVINAASLIETLRVAR